MSPGCLAPGAGHFLADPAYRCELWEATFDGGESAVSVVQWEQLLQRIPGKYIHEDTAPLPIFRSLSACRHQARRHGCQKRELGDLCFNEIMS